jgi:hypothetical protein
LIVAVWPQLWPEIRRRPAKIALWLGLGLLGFLPYLYLPLRAEAGATWVYGNPSNWQGFWEQFNGAEADYLFGWPDTYEQFQQNFEQVNELLVNELSIAGVGLGILGLAVGFMRIKYRRYSLALILSALMAYGFSTVLYYDILATLILSITLSLALGWVLLADSLLQRPQVRRRHPAAVGSVYFMLAGLALAGSFWLNKQNAVWIYDLTHDETGIETIELAQHAPSGTTLMMDWGPRYFAVGFAQDVEGRLQHFDRVDHKGNFQRIVANGTLVTPEYTLYRKPVMWWEWRLNSPVYLTAAGPELVQIDTEPHLLPVTDWPEVELADNAPPVAVLDYGVTCSQDRAVLQVDWLALATPDRDMSVMVHLVGAADSPQILEADQLHPVYGWRPLTTWQAGEVVRDFYPVERLPGGDAIRFGLYEVLSEPPFFANYLVHTASIDCD